MPNPKLYELDRPFGSGSNLEGNTAPAITAEPALGIDWRLGKVQGLSIGKTLDNGSMVWSDCGGVQVLA